MKILIIKTFPLEIKTTHLTYNVQEIGLAVALRKKGYEADVLCCSDDGDNHESIVEQEGVLVTVFARKAIRFLKNGYFRRVDNLLRRYDILQAEEYNQMFSWHLAKKYPEKTVVYHGPYYCDFNRNYNRMARVFDAFFLHRYKKLNTTFLTKSRLAEKYLRNKGLSSVKTIGVGLNTTFLTQSELQEDVKAIEPIRDYKGLKLLYIGQLEERRNAKFLIDILSKVKEKRPETKLILVGKFANEAYRNDFDLHLDSFKLRNSIIHIERMEQSQLAGIYRSCDIFVFPTRYDIYGMVLLEAMYFGLPVVSTVNGGSDMMITDGKNGVIIDGYNAKTWAEKIITIVQDKDYRKHIGEKANKTILQSYTWDDLVERFINIYQNKLNQ